MDLKRYTRKSDINVLLDHCVVCYEQKGLTSLLAIFHDSILYHKVKFPLLEHCARVLYESITEEDLIPFCNEVCKRKTEGGNVVLGILMQKYAESHFQVAVQKTTTYLADADQWYVSDIIGERFFGVGMLVHFEKFFVEMKKLSKHESHWVVRALGAGGHYAIKKGLGLPEAERLFLLLLSASNSSHKEIRQGIGWAAKTTAKFHPGIIEKYQTQISAQSVPNWFRSKIEIGLNRNAYAQSKRG